MKVLYRTYQLLIALPLVLCATTLTALATIIGCALGGAKTWGYYPAMLWSRFMCWIMLLPVKVEGRELLDKKQSYVFVANHQGPYDIFLVYGYLGRSFRWMMKKSLRNIPLVGKACESAGHIMVDKSGPKAIHRTYEQAEQVLKHGVSLVVFPEGARSFTGHMAKFRRGAFQLADELHLPVVPVTIDGSFDVLPRQKGINFVTWHRLRLVIHAPIVSEEQGSEAVQKTLEQSYETIMQALPPQYQGFVENPDQ
ncbi:MAG: 1-acyl-sn-glycerol-3-phosphate acyltransferase [Bacteroidaceae bacterium]|nr:1-acyl-sn-glycerol-3-phosphate acyltransferase [Bacteroidaceae bacterium]